MRSLAWIPCVSLLASAAVAGGLEHGPIQEPEIVAIVDAQLIRVGTITYAEERDGLLYVAGTEGVAAVGADGKPLWAARLAHADLRSIDVDATHIAVVSQNLDVPEPASAVKSFYFGEVADYPGFKDSSLALLDKGRRGAVVWTTPMEGNTRVAPPGLGAVRIAYSDGRTLTLVNRADGGVGPKAKTVMSAGILEGLIGKYRDAETRNKPVYNGDGFYSAFESELALVDPVSGTDRWRKSNHGLLSAFQNITAGPLVWGDKLVFGNAPMPISSATRVELTFKMNMRPKVFVANLKGEQVWNDAIADDLGGIGSLAVHGDRLYAATNVMVAAYDSKGKSLWTVSTARKNGALMVSPNRGVRYINGNFAVRMSPGFCMTADDRHVYVSSQERSNLTKDWTAEFQLGLKLYEKMSYGGAQVVTVLDAASGKYVETLDAKGAILDLIMVGPNLAVIDYSQVRFFKPPA